MSLGVGKGGVRGTSCLPGFKDFHLSDVCVPSILVVGEDADLKEKGFHWSV